MLAQQIFATVHVMRKPKTGDNAATMFRETTIFDDLDEYEDGISPLHSEEEEAAIRREAQEFQKQGIKI